MSRTQLAVITAAALDGHDVIGRGAVWVGPFEFVVDPLPAQPACVGVAEDSSSVALVSAVGCSAHSVTVVVVQRWWPPTVQALRPASRFWRSGCCTVVGRSVWSTSEPTV